METILIYMIINKTGFDYVKSIELDGNCVNSFSFYFFIF
jgi:hypothetical protein